MLNLSLDNEKKLNHLPEELYHNLVLAKITSVHVEEYEIAVIDDNGNPNTSEYAGLKMPRLIIETERIIKPWSIDKNPREQKFSWGVVSIKNNTTGIMLEQKDVIKRVSEQFIQIIHIHSVLRRHYNKATELVPALDIDAINAFDPFTDAKTRCANMLTIFTDIANKFNVSLNEKPMFQDIELCWVLIPGGSERSMYVIPQYLGKGFVEIFHNEKHNPAISIPPNVIMKLGKLEQKQAKPKANLTDAFSAFDQLNAGNE